MELQQRSFRLFIAGVCSILSLSMAGCSSGSTSGGDKKHASATATPSTDQGKGAVVQGTEPTVIKHRLVFNLKEDMKLDGGEGSSVAVSSDGKQLAVQGLAKEKNV